MKVGKASRWLKALFGIQSKQKDTTNGQSKDKQNRSSGHHHHAFDSEDLCSTPAFRPPDITPAQWLTLFYSEHDNDEKARATAAATAAAVDAATSAAADGAFAAAQVAAAVDTVRFTSQDTVMFSGIPENCAAVKIQSVFRGHLARRALWALKALVKIQALVRGFLVRKKIAATFCSIQALIRAQTSARVHRFINNECLRTIEVDAFKLVPISLPIRRRVSGQFFNTNRYGIRNKIAERNNSWLSNVSQQPSYMNKTQSTKPKFVRSQSAPKIRLHQEAPSLKNDVTAGRLGRSSHFVRDPHHDF